MDSQLGTKILKPYLFDGARVLEWGSGHSTCELQKLPIELLSVEHNPQWHKVTKECGAQLVAEDEYVEFPKGTFDLVVVDGIKRKECLRRARKLMNPGGVIILDDAWRVEYWSAMRWWRGRFLARGVWAEGVWPSVSIVPHALFCLFWYFLKQLRIRKIIAIEPKDSDGALLNLKRLSFLQGWMDRP